MTDDVRDVNTETTDATEVAEIDSAAGEAGDSATEAFDTDSATESTAQKGQRHRDLWRMQVTLKPVPVILILLMLISGARRDGYTLSNTDPISRRTPAPPVLPSPRRLTGQSRCCRIHPTRSTKTSLPPGRTSPAISCPTTTSSRSRSWLRRPNRSH